MRSRRKRRRKDIITREQWRDSFSPKLDRYILVINNNLIFSPLQPSDVLGGKNDAYLLLKVTVISSLLVNLFGILVYMQYDHLLIPLNPSEHHENGLLRLLVAFESALSSYHSDGQIMVGWMLSCWFIGYNVI